MKKAFRIFILLLLLPIVYLGGVITWVSLTDYLPAKIEVIDVSKAPISVNLGDTLEVMTWNIGYAGLSNEMDFFFDGGKSVRSTEKHMNKNLEYITNYLSQQQADFLVLQEVDTDSRRSYHTQQFDSIQNALPNMQGHFTPNYSVNFVIKPFTEPLGKVTSGLSTFSNHMASSTSRYALASESSWPDKYFLLDRCFMVKRYPLANGKEFVLINTHNSPYTTDSIRKQQNDRLEKIAIDEANKGNYILLSGDWNQLPPHYKPEFLNTENAFFNYTELPSSFLKNWKIAYDPKVPSNRDLNFPYITKQTHRQVIDFFILSPNITIIDVKAIDQNFEYTDHHPIFLKFQLN